MTTYQPHSTELEAFAATLKAVLTAPTAVICKDTDEYKAIEQCIVDLEYIADTQKEDEAADDRAGAICDAAAFRAGA